MPFSLLRRVRTDIRIGEGLIEITACNHIIACIRFLLQNLTEYGGLCLFTFSVILCLKMQIHQYQLMITAFDRHTVYHDAAFELGQTDRP